MPSRPPSVNAFPHHDHDESGRVALTTTPAAFVRIATGPSPATPAAVVRTGDTFYVDGVATVQARPHRKARHARQLAERIAREPAAYLNVLTGFDVPGVVDHRPTSHADQSHGRTGGAR